MAWQIQSKNEERGKEEGREEREGKRKRGEWKGRKKKGKKEIWGLDGASNASQSVLSHPNSAYIV